MHRTDEARAFALFGTVLNRQGCVDRFGKLERFAGLVKPWNEEAGGVWLRRIVETYPHFIWLNPTPDNWWPHTHSVQLVREIIGPERMFPLTLTGVDNAMKSLSKR